MVESALGAVELVLLAAIASPWMLLVLFTACLIDGFLPPVPSELLLMTAAVVTWVSQPHEILLVIMTAAVGAWAGDNAAYMFGRWIGLSRLPWMRRGKAVRLIHRLRREFRRRPEAILLTGRFVPVGRVLLTMTAGAVRLPYQRFLTVSLVSAVAWAGVSVLVAILVGAFVTPEPLAATVIAVVIALVGGTLLDRVLVWRRGITMQGRNA